MQQTKERIAYLDIARGVAIIGMLIGHAMHLFDCRIEWIMNWFWSFHMPLFAILSGFFYKDYSLIQHLKHGFKTLIVPYYSVALFCLFTMVLVEIINNQVSINDILQEFWKILYFSPETIPFGFWFVLALFVARLYFCIIRAISKSYIWMTSFSLFLFFVVFNYFPIKQSYLQTTQALMFPIYMTIGFILRKECILDKIGNHYGCYLAIIILCFASAFNVDLSIFKLPLGMLNIITTSAISIALFIICKKISDIKNDLLLIINNYFTFCGNHSLLILSIHSILIYSQFWKKFPLVYPEIIATSFIIGTVLFSYAFLYVYSRCYQKYKIRQ